MGQNKCKNVVFDHNWGDKVSMNDSLIAKLHVFFYNNIYILEYTRANSPLLLAPAVGVIYLNN